MIQVGRRDAFGGSDGSAKTAYSTAPTMPRPSCIRNGIGELTGGVRS